MKERVLWACGACAAAAAMLAVLGHTEYNTPDAPVFEVYVVWNAYILGNMKALLSTTVEDGMYYEVTFNKAKNEIYLDAYKHAENICYTI